MTRQRVEDLSRYANEICERDWRLNPIEVLNVREGILHRLRHRYPASPDVDIEAAAELLRVRVCQTLSDLGRWPTGKGSYDQRLLDEMLLGPDTPPALVNLLAQN